MVGDINSSFDNIVALNIKIQDLTNILKNMKENNVEIKRIHDF